MLFRSGSGGQSPFYKANTAALNFQAGNASRVDAASAVVIKIILKGKGGPMGMAGNENMILFLCPMLKPFFRFVLSRVILGRAGGVQDTEMFQGFP